MKDIETITNTEAGDEQPDLFADQPLPVALLVEVTAGSAGCFAPAEAPSPHPAGAVSEARA